MIGFEKHMDSCDYCKDGANVYGNTEYRQDDVCEIGWRMLGESAKEGTPTVLPPVFRAFLCGHAEEFGRADSTMVRILQEVSGMVKCPACENAELIESHRKKVEERLRTDSERSAARRKDPSVCCCDIPDSAQGSCVCSFVSSCAQHGVKHHGTHD